MNPATRRGLWWVLIAGLTLAILAVSAIGGWQFTVKQQHLPPVAESAEARQEVLDAAMQNTVKLLTYSADTVEQDTQSALSNLTGEFLNYYRQFTRDVVVPAARQNGVSTSATAAQRGVISLSTDDAQVLIFVNQTTKSNENPEGSLAQSTVKIGLNKVDGVWLINAFDPL